MGIPGTLGAVSAEQLGQGLCVFGEMFERNRAILDKGNRLAVPLHAHHDVEPGLAHVPQGLLLRSAGHFHHRAGQAEVAHEGGEMLQGSPLDIQIVAGELHQQQGLGRAHQRALDHWTEGGIVERQIGHGAVHQFHRHGGEADDVPRQIHGLVERGKVHHPEHLVNRQGRKAQGDLPAEGKRALGAHQQVGQIGHSVQRVGLRILAVEQVEVVAGDAAQHLGRVGGKLAIHAPRDGLNGPDEMLRVWRRLHLRKGTELQLLAVRQHRVDGLHIVNHVAVVQRARAA